MIDEPPAALPSATVTAGAPAPRPHDGPAPAGYLPLFDLASPHQITMATFCAGPGAATWLLARNFARLGRTTAMVATIVGGLAAVGLIFYAAFALPESAPRMTLILPQLGLTWLVAQGAQGAAYSDHRARGGPQTGNGRVALIAVGAGVGSLAAIVAVALAAGVFDDDRPPMVRDDAGHELFYTDGATAAEAHRVGAALTEVGFLTHRPASITVQRPAGRLTIGMVVTQRARDGEVDDAFAEIAARLSHDHYDDAPIDLWLLDNQLRIKRRLPWPTAP